MWPRFCEGFFPPLHQNALHTLSRNASSSVALWRECILLLSTKSFPVFQHWCWLAFKCCFEFWTHPPIGHLSSMRHLRTGKNKQKRHRVECAVVPFHRLPFAFGLIVWSLFHIHNPQKHRHTHTRKRMKKKFATIFLGLASQQQRPFTQLLITIFMALQSCCHCAVSGWMQIFVWNR